MRRKLRRTLLLACMSLALAPLGNVQAALILQDVVLSWGNFVLANPLGGTTVMVNGGELRWGTPHPSTPFTGLGGQSAIRASSLAPINLFQLDSSTAIVDLPIVDLLYFNANLSPPQSITSADLSLFLVFDQGSAEATYRITINETPDPAIGDPLGREADTITASEAISSDSLDDFTITFQDMLFLRALEGGTAEGAISMTVAAVQAIPEPSVLWVFATGLLVLLGTSGLMHRSKRRAISDRNPWSVSQGVTISERRVFGEWISPRSLFIGAAKRSRCLDEPCRWPSVLGPANT